MISPAFSVLSSQRLLLRQLLETDEASIFALRTDERVNRFIDRPAPKEISEARAFIRKINNGIERGETFYWAITLQDKPELIGTICIWNISADKKTGELGYELLPAFQGRGIMREAVGRVISFAFEAMGLTKLEAFTHKDNTPSTRLLLAHGFVLVPERMDAENENYRAYVLRKSLDV